MLHDAGRKGVVPFAELRAIPHAPGWLSGLLRYRGDLVPVVDLSLLLGASATVPRMSRRIIIDAVVIGGVARKIGLLVASVVDVKQIEKVFPDKSKAFGVIADESFVSRDGESIQFPGVTATLSLTTSSISGRQQSMLQNN